LGAAVRLARELGDAVIAVAHTQDDQAETVLEWALMGGGVRGMGATSGSIVRPLLDVSRADVEAFCRALHLRPRRDESNLDARFLRNALRLNGIPALERATRRAIREPLARTATLAAEDDRELHRQMLAIWPEAVEESQGATRIATERLRSLSRPVARRLIGRAVFRLGLPATDAVIEAVVDLAAGRPGRRRDLTAGLKARREGGYVLLSRTSPESRV
jgi:tRNA(Ile)-lysidine synthase